MTEPRNPLVLAARCKRQPLPPSVDVLVPFRELRDRGTTSKIEPDDPGTTSKIEPDELDDRGTTSKIEPDDPGTTSKIEPDDPGTTSKIEPDDPGTTSNGEPGDCGATSNGEPDELDDRGTTSNGEPGDCSTTSKDRRERQGFNENAFRRNGLPFRIRAKQLLIVIASGVTVSMACQSIPNKGAQARRVALGGDRVAQVDSLSISEQMLTEIERQSGVSAEKALEKTIQTHLISRWAASGGLSLGRRQTVERALLARVLLERIQVQVQQPPTPSDAEVLESTQSRWLELDRPDAFRVTHFVVRTEDSADSKAQKVAERIALVVKGAVTTKDFIERAKSVSTEGYTVVAESLSPVTADGRIFQLDPTGKPVTEEGTYDRDFAQAAARLQIPGSQSGIVRTRFGLHVLMLEERIAGHTVPFEERRNLLLPDVLRRRARRIVDATLAARRREIEPQVDRAALEWMGHVKVSP